MEGTAGSAANAELISFISIQRERVLGRALDLLNDRKMPLPIRPADSGMTIHAERLRIDDTEKSLLAKRTYRDYRLSAVDFANRPADERFCAAALRCASLRTTP